MGLELFPSMVGRLAGKHVKISICRQVYRYVCGQVCKGKLTGRQVGRQDVRLAGRQVNRNIRRKVGRFYMKAEIYWAGCHVSRQAGS